MVVVRWACSWRRALAAGGLLGRALAAAEWRRSAAWSGSTLGLRPGWWRGGRDLRLSLRFAWCLAWRRRPLTFATGAPHGWSPAAGTVGAYRGCLFCTLHLLHSIRLRNRHRRCRHRGLSCIGQLMLIYLLRLLHLPSDRRGRFDCFLGSGWWRACGSRQGWGLAAGGMRLGGVGTATCASSVGRRSGWRRGDGTLVLRLRFAWRRTPLISAIGAPHAWVRAPVSSRTTWTTHADVPRRRARKRNLALPSK